MILTPETYSMATEEHTVSLKLPTYLLDSPSEVWFAQAETLPLSIKKQQRKYRSHQSTTFVYIDDILGASRYAESHKQHLCLLFQRLQQHGLVINVPKCQFGHSSLDFRGHCITGTGIMPLDAITQFERTTTVKGLQDLWALSTSTAGSCTDDDLTHHTFKLATRGYFLGNRRVALLCDTYTGHPRSIIPASWRCRTVCHTLQCVPQETIAKQCIPCRASKI